MNEKLKLAFAILASAICFAFFKIVLDSDFSAFTKFILAVISLAACGYSIAMAFRLEVWGGMFLLKSQAGLGYLDRLAKSHPRLWQAFAEIGLIIGFGALSYFAVGRRRAGWRDLPVLAIGAIMLILVSSLLPIAMATLLSMVTGAEEFTGASAKLQASFSGIEAIKYISIFLLIVGGISLATSASIITYAVLVGMAILAAVSGNGAPLEGTVPGGMPIIPGVNIDLVQGILALAVVLLVHEGMHGVLARLYNLPLKSAGLVFFGFLPFGAFVDIDEKKLFAAKKEQQNAVLVAGTAANFFTSIVFLLALAIVAAFAGPDPSDAVRFLSRFLAMTFALNTIVAAVNLVPIPLFDGYHIMRNIVGNKTVAKAIALAIVAAFLLTLAPWVLR